MTEFQNSSKQTAHKAHWTALIMLLTQIVFMLVGVTDLDPSMLRGNIEEVITLAVAILGPAVMGWLVPYYVPNQDKDE